MSIFDQQPSININLEIRYRNFLSLRGAKSREIQLGDLSQQGLERNRFSIEKHLIASRGAQLFDLSVEENLILLSDYLPAITMQTRGSFLLVTYDPIGRCATPFDSREVQILNEALAPPAEPTDLELFSDEVFVRKADEFRSTFDSSLAFLINWITEFAALNEEFAAQMVRLNVLTPVTTDGVTRLVALTIDQARNLNFDKVFSISIQAGKMPENIKSFLDKILFVLASKESDAAKSSYFRMTDTGVALEQQLKASFRTRQVKVPDFFKATVQRGTNHSHFTIRFYLISKFDVQQAIALSNSNLAQPTNDYIKTVAKPKANLQREEDNLPVSKDILELLSFFDNPGPIVQGLTDEELKRIRALHLEQLQAYEEAHTMSLSETAYADDVRQMNERETRRQEKKKLRKIETSKTRKTAVRTIMSEIGEVSGPRLDFDNIFYFIQAAGGNVERLSDSKANLDFFTGCHIYYTSRLQLEENDPEVKHAFAFQRSLQFLHNFHYDSNEFTVTRLGYCQIVELSAFERYQNSYSEPTMFYTDFIIGVLSYLKSGHHATSANIVNMATKIYKSLGWELSPEEIRMRIRSSLYQGGHPGSVRMQLMYIHLRNQSEPLSNSIMLRLNTNPPISMPFLNLALYIEGLAKVQFFKFMGSMLHMNIEQFRENIDLINKLKHFAAPYSNYLYGQVVVLPAHVVEQVQRFSPLARALHLVLPNSTLNMSASLRKLILQSAAIDISSDVTVQAYIGIFKAQIRQITSQQMGLSANLINY